MHLSDQQTIHKQTNQNPIWQSAIPASLIGSSPEGEGSSLLSAAEALAVLRQRLLVEGQTERLSRSTQSGSFTRGGLGSGSIRSSSLLDLLLALNALTPGSQHHVTVEVLHEALPVGHMADVGITVTASLVQKRSLDGGEGFLSTLGNLRPLYGELASGSGIVTTSKDNLLLLEVLGANFNTERHSLLLPVVELPAGIVVLTVVELHTHSCIQQKVTQFLGLEMNMDIIYVKTRASRQPLKNRCTYQYMSKCKFYNDYSKRMLLPYLITQTLDILRRSLGVVDVDDDSLSGSHARRQHQSLVIAVHHDHHSNRTSGQTPTVLPDMLTLYPSIHLS